MGSTNRSARDLGSSDLVWDFMSRPRTESMLDRVQPAADAGYAALGIFLSSWVEMRDDPDAVARFEDALGRTGLVLANIETARGWAAPDRPTAACLEMEALAWEIADRCECRYLQVIGDYEGTLAEAGRGFAALCDRAADHGLLGGLEPVPQRTTIDSLALAAEIVERADRDNGGICFDSWHFTRSTNDIADIDALDGQRILSTQWNDGTVEPAIADYYTDTLASRVAPGEGEFQLVEMIKALNRIGCTAPVGLEVPGAALWVAPIDEAASHVAEAMRRILAEARATS